MKITEFLKKELQGWNYFEISGLVLVFIIIFTNAIFLKDSPAAVINAVCGILYTLFAGKGKISCYFFGLAGSMCYIYLAFKNALWGNMSLYLLYYIPMQIIGIFKWKKHLKQDTKEITKIKLPAGDRLKLIFLAIAGCVFTIMLLVFF